MGFSVVIKSVHRPFLFPKVCSLTLREMHHIILKLIYQNSSELLKWIYSSSFSIFLTHFFVNRQFLN